MAAPRTILVVEDELFIRMMAADTLLDAGFAVLEAGDAAEAMHVLANAAEIAVLFTDVNMPGDMDGIALAHHTAGNYPAIGVIVTSGGSWISEDRLPCRGRFLAKPYCDRDLVGLAHAQVRAA